MIDEAMKETSGQGESSGQPEQTDGGQSFADMMKDFDQSGAGGEPLRVGDKVQGRVISISADSVFIDAGSKIDGIVDIAEVRTPEGEVQLNEGDILELYVVAIDGGTLRLSKAVSGQGGAAGLELLRDAFENRVPVEGFVKGTNKGGFEIRAMGKRAFCPLSQMELGFVQDPTPFVGQTLQFLVIKFEENGRNIVLSRREILDRERKEATEKFVNEIVPGTVMTGHVKSLAPYGAFVELAPGLSGLVHVSEISWSRVDDPTQVLTAGQEVQVKVLAVEPGKKKDQLKVSLSMKQAEADPWTTIEGRFNPGDKISGKVVRLADFGAFVEIAPGIEGLVHVSEMSYVKRIMKPSEVVQPGQDVTVVIKELDLGHRRIGLSLRDAEGDPWAEAESKYSRGATVTGTVEKREQFGVFVNLEPGVTGLLPKSKISRAKDPAPLENLKPGEQVTLLVEEVNPRDRKITLGPVESREAPPEEWKRHGSPRHNKEPQVETFGDSGSANGMSLLGDKLRAAMERSKK